MTTTTNSAEVSGLLPCPFCGGEARLVEGEESAYVQCMQVKMHRALWFDGDNDASNEVRDQWNRRSNATAAIAGVGEAEPCNAIALKAMVLADQTAMPTTPDEGLGVKVKPLEWVAAALVFQGSGGLIVRLAPSALGEYRVVKGSQGRFDGYVDRNQVTGSFDTIEGTQEALSRWHETRILSALQDQRHEQ